MADNARDMHKRGRYRGGWGTGEANRNTRLTADDVAIIRRRARDEGYGAQRKMAAEYGISESGINKIVSRVTWAHVQ